MNVDLTPVFARLGAPSNHPAAVLWSPSTATRTPARRMLKRAVISGLPSAGVNVTDLQTVPIPVARHYTANSPASGGVLCVFHRSISALVDIRFLATTA